MKVDDVLSVPNLTIRREKSLELPKIKSPPQTPKPVPKLGFPEFNF